MLVVEVDVLVVVVETVCVKPASPLSQHFVDIAILVKLIEVPV
jgi:hypothetical protein